MTTALTTTKASLFVTPGTAKEITIGADAKGTPIKVSLGTAAKSAALEEQVSTILGHTSERRQEAIAEIARTNYGAYLALKRDIINALRTEVENLYADQVVRFKEAGLSDTEALEAAREAALAHKAAQMKLIRLYFPDQGQKIQNVF